MESIASELESITAELWGSMFTDLELTNGGTLAAGRQRTCLVWIEGDPQRALLARFPEDLAVLLTQSLLGEVDQPDSTAIVDAVGEIGNILAGNVKACFGQHAQLSLPAVTSGADFEIETVGTRQVASRTFTTGDHVFAVEVLEAVRPVGNDAATTHDPS